MNNEFNAKIAYPTEKKIHKIALKYSKNFTKNYREGGGVIIMGKGPCTSKGI